MKKSISRKIEQLKQRIKTAVIVASVALPSFGATQNAAAQTSQDNPKSSEEFEAKKFNAENKELNLEDGLYKYFYADGGDNGIYIDVKDLAQSLKSAGVNGASSESKKFIDSYLNNVDDNGKITFWNFNKVLQESLQPQHVQAFCDGLHEIFKAKEAKQEQKDVKMLRVKNADIQYSIGDKGISIKGNVAIDINKLMPPVYQLQNKQYKCGTAVSPELSVVREMEAANLRNVVLEHYVYNDLCSSADASNPVVKNFMKEHQEDMKAHGLSMDAKGNFIQQANIQAMQNAKMQIR